jgi:hypothetical protein
MMQQADFPDVSGLWLAISTCGLYLIPGFTVAGHPDLLHPVSSMQ